jgi:DNA modification methylase
MGSGTVGLVAVKHGRSFVGIDLGYHDISERRIREAQAQTRLEFD